MPDVNLLFSGAGAADVAAVVDGVQQLLTGVTRGDGPGTEVRVVRLEGFCDGGVAIDVVRGMAEWSRREDVAFCAAVVRGVAHVAWGRRVGGEDGFGGEVAELFVFQGGKVVVVEMGAEG